VLAGTTGLVGRTGPAYAAQRVRPPKTIELETVVVGTGVCSSSARATARTKSPLLLVGNEVSGTTTIWSIGR
jgi:hypothetical protein